MFLDIKTLGQAYLLRLTQDPAHRALHQQGLTRPYVLVGGLILDSGLCC